MAHQVFVSHSSKDKHLADAVVATLEKHGIKCFVAPRDILPGASWAKSILEGIEESRLMLLVFSEHTNASEHCRREVERAVKFQVPVVPLRVQDVLPADEMEYFLSASHWMDAITPPFEQHLAQLSEKFKVLLDLKPQPKEAEPKPSESVAPPLPLRSPVPPTKQAGERQSSGDVAEAASALMNARLPAWVAVAGITAVLVLAIAVVIAIFVFTRNGSDKTVAMNPPNPAPKTAPEPIAPQTLVSPTKPEKESTPKVENRPPEKAVEPAIQPMKEDPVSKALESAGLKQPPVSLDPAPKPPVDPPPTKALSVVSTPIAPTPTPAVPKPSPLPPPTTPAKSNTPAPPPAKAPVKADAPAPRPADAKVRIRAFTPAGTSWAFSNSQELVGTTTASSAAGRFSSQVKNVETSTGRAEVLESDPQGRPTAVRLTYDAGCSITTEINGATRSTPTPLAGHTITIRKDKDGDVENDFNGDLDPSTENYLDQILESNFGMPPNPVGVGDTWTVPAKEVAEKYNFDENRSRLSATAKLKEFKDVGGRRAAVVEVIFNMRGAMNDGSNVENQTTATAMIDVQTGESLQGTARGTIHVVASRQEQAANGMPVFITIETQGTLKTTAEQKFKTIGKTDANAAPLAGTFKNDNLTIVFIPGNPSPSIQISFGETKYTGTVSNIEGTTFSGKFKSNEGEEYDFSGSLDGSDLTFKSTGTEYKLTRKNPFAK